MEKEEEETSCLLTLPLPLGDEDESSSSFNLEKAVCSHGLFMMPPNVWDPSTKTLQRPLRLLSDPSTSLTVRISSPPPPPPSPSSSSSSSSLHVLVLGTLSLSTQDQQFILAQVARMLRLSENEEINIREFHKIYPEAKNRGFGRVFRSPTLFEDMVKCILLCNCQWPRTLAMARALCKLQLDLKSDSFGHLVAEATSKDPGLKASTEDFLPKTPNVKESKRKRIVNKIHCTNLESKFAKSEAELEVDVKSCLAIKEDDACGDCKPSEILNDNVLNTCSISDSQLPEVRTSKSSSGIGDFPSPSELANLDETFLAKHCSLGYRAARIVKLARIIVEGKLQLQQLEEVVSAGAIPSLYDKLAAQLLEIDGFGPFTCANVLMCMGFYQVIPVDTETIRHLKKVHKICCTNRTVQKEVEKVYGKYRPFQFLTYWSEIWQFYEESFGKTSEMPPSNYQLITASNMRTKRKK